MTVEETSEDNSQKENVESTYTPKEPDENGGMAHLFKEAYEKAGQKMPAAEKEDAEPVKVEKPEEGDEDDDTPEESAPRGRRAKREYEEKKQLESEKAKLEAENAAYKKLVESLKGGNEPKKEASEVEEMDAYLLENGLNPENFIDDEAKKATYIVLKKANDTEKDNKQTKEDAARAKYNSTLNAQYASLPKESQLEITRATQHVLQSEAAQLKIMNPAISDEDAQRQATANLDNIMHSVYQNGKNPLEWTWQYAQTIGYQPAPEKQEKPADVDPEKIEKLRQKAGAPTYDTADTGGLNSGQPKVKMTPQAKAAFDHLKEYAG